MTALMHRRGSDQADKGESAAIKLSATFYLVLSMV